MQLVLAPDWLTMEHACELTGYSQEMMQQLIEDGAVDLKDRDDILIEKRGLIKYQEALALVADRND